MKNRGIRIPTTSYDALRQQVQAKRGSPTNRKEAEGPAGPPAEAEAIEAERPPVGSSGGPVMDDAAPTPAPAAATPSAATTAAVLEAEPAPQAPPGAPEAPQARHATPPGRAGGQRVTLKLNFTAPAAGAYPHYDRVIETMPPRSAVPLLLAKAFEELEASARRGEDIRRADYTAERNGERISTSRTMDAETLERLRASVDPHNLMKPSSLGAALATTALSLYLRKHS